MVFGSSLSPQTQQASSAPGAYVAVGLARLHHKAVGALDLHAGVEAAAHQVQEVAGAAGRHEARWVDEPTDSLRRTALHCTGIRCIAAAHVPALQPALTAPSCPAPHTHART